MVVGALEFSRLNRSKSISKRRPPPSENCLLLRRSTMLIEGPFREGDRVAIVDHGRVIAMGSPRELIDAVDISNLPPPEPRKTSATLEDVFVSLTGRGLHDE